MSGELRAISLPSLDMSLGSGFPVTSSQEQQASWITHDEIMDMPKKELEMWDAGRL